MAAGVHMWCHQIKHMRERCPPFTSAKIFGWYGSDLLGGVDIRDLDSRIQVYRVKQLIQVHTVDTVGSGDLSRGRAPAIHDDLDSLVIFEDTRRCPLAGGV